MVIIYQLNVIIAFAVAFTEGSVVPFITDDLSYSLLGLQLYTQEHVRTIMDTYEIYNRNFNYMSNSKFYTRKVNVEISSYFSTSGKNNAMLREISFIEKQALFSNNLTDLFVTVFVQFTAMYYAFQFAQAHSNLNHVDLDQENKYSEFHDNAELAYYLAFFATESLAPAETIDNILSNKYPAASRKFKNALELLKKIRNELQENIVNYYEPSFGEIENIEVYNFLAPELRSDMRWLTTYFRELLFGKVDGRYNTVIDLEGPSDMWKYAGEFKRHIRSSGNKIKTARLRRNSEPCNSNVIAVLRAIELFKARDQNSDHSWRNTNQKPELSYDQFLILLPWYGSAGKLHFNRMSFTDLMNFEAPLKVIQEEEHFEDDSFTLLGLSEFEIDDVRAVMEVLDIYGRGFHYVHKRKLLTEGINHPLKIDPFIDIERDPFDKDWNYEFKYIFWQIMLWNDDRTSYIEDLFAALFVQYMAVIYAIRFSFAANVDELDHVDKFEDVANYLTVFGTEMYDTMTTIKDVLDAKYGQEICNEFHIVFNSLNVIRSWAYEKILKYKYPSTPSDDDNNETESIKIFNEDRIHRDVQIANEFFLYLITGKTLSLDENVVDIKGCSRLFSGIDIFNQIMHIERWKILEIMEDYQQDMYISNILSIIKYAESVMGRGKFPQPTEALHGFPDEFLSIESTKDKSGRKRLRFNKYSLK